MSADAAAPALPELPVAASGMLLVGALEARFEEPLGERPSPAWLALLLALDAPAPLARDEGLRQAVRDLLREGGYKPTGRGKPASEYLVKACAEGLLRPINPAVDACNAVSLASGLPISVVDLERARAPLSIAVAGPDERYVFNAAGQTIELAGLPCLRDALGPCGNAVKDSERTKTGPATRRTLSVLWAPRGAEERLGRSMAWYRELLERLGARTATWLPRRQEPEPGERSSNR